MFEQEFEANAPYDNVEFPIRKSGTGTWPGPGTGNVSSSSSGSAGNAGPKLFGHQTIGRTGGGQKLAPLVEVEGSADQDSAENHRHQTSFGSSSTTSAISSSSSMSSSHQNQHQYKFGQQTKTTQNKGMSSPNQTKTGGYPGVETRAFSTGAVTSASTSTTSATTTSTTTTASTKTVTATTTVASSVSSSNETQKTANNKPVIVPTNDQNTYIATQVSSTSMGSQKKKSLKHTETEDEDFKRHDLNPGARVTLEKVYTQHPDFYQLNTKVLDEGSLLKQDVLEIYRRTGESLTYEQLLQGMLVDGERFLLGSCWLYFTHVQFLDMDGQRTLKEPYGKGRIGLTSKRALFLSTEVFTDANLEQFKDDKDKKDTKVGYKLEVSKQSTIIFKNIPLTNFHSAEMEVVTGTAAQTKITRKTGCCSCFGGKPANKWVSTPPMTRSINSRVIRIGVSMPPWQTRMFLDIHLDPSMSLTVARDFISQLHAFAPHMH